MAVTRLRPLQAGRAARTDGERERSPMRELQAADIDRARAAADAIVDACCGALRAAPARPSRP